MGRRIRRIRSLRSQCNGVARRHAHSVPARGALHHLQAPESLCQGPILAQAALLPPCGPLRIGPLRCHLSARLVASLPTGANGASVCRPCVLRHSGHDPLHAQSWRRAPRPGLTPRDRCPHVPPGAHLHGLRRGTPRDAIAARRPARPVGANPRRRPTRPGAAAPRQFVLSLRPRLLPLLRHLLRVPEVPRRLAAAPPGPSPRPVDQARRPHDGWALAELGALDVPGGRSLLGRDRHSEHHPPDARCRLPRGFPARDRQEQEPRQDHLIDHLGRQREALAALAGARRRSRRRAAA
mmetsp:Transcript_36588/g.91448  ORF Transcript_36588/g.91448 Transcript_36588/m.91448 type:complete len:295 (-) Transcript_36588:100-984(-)